METLFKILADSVVLVHFGFVAFVVFGGLIVYKRYWVMWVHIPAAAWGALIEFIGWPCPLTPLENMLRRRAGAAGYEEGFIERYMIPILYPIGLSRETQFVLGCVVLVVNLLVYGWLYQRWRRACLIVLGTDSHAVEELRFIQFGVYQARRGGLEAVQIANTRPLSEFLKLRKRS